MTMSIVIIGCRQLVAWCTCVCVSGVMCVFCLCLLFSSLVFKTAWKRINRTLFQVLKSVSMGLQTSCRWLLCIGSDLSEA